MRSTNAVEDKSPRKARLKRIGRFLSRPVSALSRARTRVQRRRRPAVAQSCSASASEAPSLAPVSIDDSRAPLIDVSKGYDLLCWPIHNCSCVTLSMTHARCGALLFVIFTWLTCVSLLVMLFCGRRPGSDVQTLVHATYAVTAACSLPAMFCCDVAV